MGTEIQLYPSHALTIEDAISNTTSLISAHTKLTFWVELDWGDRWKQLSCRIISETKKTFEENKTRYEDVNKSYR